ncbi:TRAP transporter small permease [Jiella sonneratiae]|uniref:TRAP transporter small permease protein n=1 Tax=Jiella sonneratiae TaxID=2816856 RepID=A0ABS3IZH2_9HYPH|nr:TRAP transporter small permease [Jiella sonneratiae]MBO0902808.1 TRAP transporter small permease [Jiella sonneratiae]
MTRSRLTERVVTIVERIAAVMLGLVTILVFVSAIGRYLFASPVPDAFDLSRLSLAIAIMWGFASLGFRGSHIKVDILAEMLGPRARRVLDLLAWLGLLLFTLLLVWKLGGRVLSQMPGGETTMDLRLPQWPFLAFVVAGLVMAVVTTLIRLWLVLRWGEGLEPYETLADDEAHGAAHE